MASQQNNPGARKTSRSSEILSEELVVQKRMEKGGVEVKVKVTQQELEQPYKTKNWVNQASNNNDSRHKICQHHQDKLNQVSSKDDITRTDLKIPKTIK